MGSTTEGSFTTHWKASATEASWTQNTSHESEVAALVDRQRPRVLVIEHDPWRRTNAVAQLTGAGYQVRDASNGFSGLRLARTALPDAIVLGAQLPEVRSSEVRAQLRGQARTRAIPVIPLPLGAAESVAADVHKILAARV